MRKWPVFEKIEKGEMMIMMVMVMVTMVPFFSGGMFAAELFHHAMMMRRSPFLFWRVNPAGPFFLHGLRGTR